MSYSAETTRIWLEPMTLEDHIEDFFELWTEPKAFKWLGQSPPTTYEETLERMVKSLPSKENPNIDKYAILLRSLPESPDLWINSKGKPKMIGLVGSMKESDEGMFAGYCLNIKYWGKGYMGEAWAAFLNLYWSLPGRTSIPVLIAWVDPDNIASSKMVARTGGRKGELLKEGYTRGIDGMKRDIQCWYFDRPSSKIEG